MRLLLLVLAVGFVALQAALGASRENGLVITSWILGLVALGGAAGAAATRSAARRAEDRRAQAEAQNATSAFIVVHHPALLGCVRSKDRNFSLGSYPLALVESDTLSIVGPEVRRLPLLEWRDVEAVGIIALSERFFIRRAVEIRVKSGVIVLAPYGRRGFVGFRAPSEDKFAEFLGSLNVASARRAG
ncbi:hypothetical protein [Rathayibacter sp. PhB151]|uniref:hypothetical protein n=1 Tax=Rathayibacter sp. PhB151 TaxID=2485189 RepID=UPI001064577D|nr:hypothetical protein [Rathayibacter sp. PhB151]